MDPAMAGLFVGLLVLIWLAWYSQRRVAGRQMGERVVGSDWRWPTDERTEVVRAVDRSYDSLARRAA